MFLLCLLGHQQRCGVWTSPKTAQGRQLRAQHPTAATGCHSLPFPASTELGKREMGGRGGSREGENGGAITSYCSSWPSEVFLSEEEMAPLGSAWLLLVAHLLL